MKPTSNIPSSNLPSGKVEQLLKDITALRDEAYRKNLQTGINEYIGQLDAYDKSIELINKILNP